MANVNLGITISGLRLCSACEKTKPTKDFYQLKTAGYGFASDSLTSECRACCRERVKERESRLRAEGDESFLQRKRAVRDRSKVKKKLEKSRLDIIRAALRKTPCS